MVQSPPAIARNSVATPSSRIRGSTAAADRGAAGGVLSGTYPNPGFSTAVNTGLSGNNNGILFGTGVFGFSSTAAPTRAGDIAYFNGSTWVTLAGNNSGAQFLQENSGGVPTWAAAGGSGANPTASVGLSAINGVATTFLRSDGAPALDQTIAPTWTGTHTFNNGMFSALFSGGPVGINNAGPTAPLHVGGVAAASLGSNVLSARNSTGTVAVHGFAENSTINLTAAGQGMDSYDARMVVSGTQNYDHLVSYQSRAQYGSSGTITNMYGGFDGAGVNAGTVTNQYGWYTAAPAGAGTITNSYGFYSEALNKAATNYSFFTPFASVFNAASLALITIGKSGNDYPGVGYNVLMTSTAGTYKYASSDFAPFMRFGPSGQIQTFTSVSGTAGNTIAFTAGPFLSQAGTNWTASSDVRLKEHIQPIDVLARLDAYRAVSFDWKETGKHDIGVIAQEMEHVFPELVVRDNPDRLGVTYAPLGAMALGGVKQLMEKVKLLEAEVAALKAARTKKRSN